LGEHFIGRTFAFSFLSQNIQIVNKANLFIKRFFIKGCFILRGGHRESGKLLKIRAKVSVTRIYGGMILFLALLLKK
jgi:hypothetical protein